MLENVKLFFPTGHEVFDRTERTRRSTMPWHTRTQADTLGLSKRPQCDSAIITKGTKDKFRSECKSFLHLFHRNLRVSSCFHFSQAGVAVNTADFKGLTPLMTACMFGKFATAAFLLGSGAQGHLTDINGDTALHWAAYKGHAELIKLLMYSGVDLQKPDYFGSTPLHLACLSSNVSCVRILCEKSKIELEPRDKNGKTPLQLAKSHRHSEIVRILQAEQKRRARWIPPINELWFVFRFF